jgi:histidine ammonia-lyase
MNHLWDAFFSGGPPSSVELFGISLRYPAATSWAELRTVAGPVTLDIPALDLGLEDVASDAPAAVAKVERALDLVEELLSIEVLMAADVLTAAAPRGLGRGSGAVLELARGALDDLGDDRSPAAAQRAVMVALRTRGISTEGS